MNDGVKILLERMETHPEEFVGDGVYSKWNDMFENYADSLDPEDVEVYRNARKVLIQQYFTEKVMEELVDPKKSSLEELLIAKRNATLSATLTPSPSIPSMTFEASEHLRAHVDAMKREIDTQKPKEHKTIFGKLFNYS